MKQLLLLCLMLLPAMRIAGQIQPIDSLLNVLNTQNPVVDQQLELYDKISQGYILYDLQKSIDYATRGLSLAEKEKNKKMMGTFNVRLGIAYYNQASILRKFASIKHWHRLWNPEMNPYR